MYKDVIWSIFIGENINLNSMRNQTSGSYLNFNFRSMHKYEIGEIRVN